MFLELDHLPNMEENKGLTVRRREVQVLDRMTVLRVFRPRVPRRQSGQVRAVDERAAEQPETQRTPGENTWRTPGENLHQQEL